MQSETAAAWSRSVASTTAACRASSGHWPQARSAPAIQSFPGVGSLVFQWHRQLGPFELGQVRGEPPGEGGGHRSEDWPVALCRNGATVSNRGGVFVPDRETPRVSCLLWVRFAVRMETRRVWSVVGFLARDLVGIGCCLVELAGKTQRPPGPRDYPLRCPALHLGGNSTSRVQVPHSGFMETTHLSGVRRGLLWVRSLTICSEAFRNTCAIAHVLFLHPRTRPVGLDTEGNDTR